MEKSVPVSGRVSPSVVKHLAEKAERLDISLSKVVGMELSQATDVQANFNRKCEEINSRWKSATGKLINKFASSSKEQKKMVEFLANAIQNQ